MPTFVFNNLTTELSWPGRRAVEIKSLSSVLFMQCVLPFPCHNCSVVKLLKTKGKLRKTRPYEPRETLFAEDKVSPPDETALARQFFQIPALRDWITTQLGPEMTGPTKTGDRRGMILHAKHSYLRHREFPEARSAESELSCQL